MGDILGFVMAHPLLSAFILIWVISWKGVALWQAARLSHTWWFIVILVVNTVGILEIIYIFFVARKYTVVEETEPANSSSVNK